MLTIRRAATSSPGPSRSPRASAVIETLQVPVENDTTGLVISAGVHGKISKPAPRGAVLTFQFYGQNGEELDVPHAGFTYSAGLGRRFQYITVDNSPGSAMRIRPVFPPSGATQLKLYLQRWSGMDQVELFGALSVEPADYALEHLAALEATDAHSAERLAWHWLTKHKEERQYLLEIQAFAWRVGASSLLRDACFLLERAPQVRGYMRHQSNLALAALEEVANWLPLAAHQPASGNSLPHVIAHLSPSITMPSLVALTEAQYERGLKPLLVIPSEYGTQVQPRAPYSRSENNGVELLELHPIIPEAHAQVKRTDILRLDTLLTSQSITRHRVGLIHAHVGRSGYDLALRALALGVQHHLPVVIQWHDPTNAFPVNDAMSPPPGSEWCQQANAQQLRCAKRADAVVVDDAWQANVLQREGVQVDKIFIVPRPLPQQDALKIAATQPRSQWVAHLDVTDLTPDQVSAVAAALPNAIKLPGLKIELTGPQAIVATLESSMIDAQRSGDLSNENAASEQHKSFQNKPDVVILLHPIKRASAAGWLADLDTLLLDETLVLAERTPQSECLVRDGQRGLTFSLTDPAEFTRALADLAPNTHISVKLLARRESLLRKRSEEAFCEALESAYRYALCSPG